MRVKKKISPEKTPEVCLASSKLTSGVSLGFVLCVALLAAWPLLTSGFIPTHDGEYHLIRFFEFDKNIRAGVFFPRWAPGLDSGLGVPLFNFFYPLPNYVGEIFHLLGFSLVESFKLTLAVGLILSGLFFYLWGKEVWDTWGGITGAVFYVLAPYHLVDVYVRGSPGEVWALAFFPAIFWVVERLIRTQNRIFLFLGSLFFAFLILSHNILALIFTPFLISYMIFLIFIFPKAKKLSAIRYPLSAILFGFGLAAYFWLPALTEAKYATGLKIVDFSQHFPTLFQLLFPSWGTGFSVPGTLDEISFQIGIPHLLAVFSGVLFLLSKERTTYRHSALACPVPNGTGDAESIQESRGSVFIDSRRRGNDNCSISNDPALKKHYFLFFLAWFVLIVFLLLEISLPFWKAIPGMSLIQYPWRLSSLMILITSSLTAYLIFLKKSKLLATILILLALIFYTGYSRPVKYPPRTDDFYLSNPIWTDGTATLGDGFNTIWLKDKPKKDEKETIFPRGKCRVEKVFESPIRHDFETNCPQSAKIQLGIAYFPGWKVLVNNEETPIDFSDGLINFQVPAGKHIIKVEFRETPIRALADRISFLSLLFLAGMVIFGIIRFQKPCVFRS